MTNEFLDKLALDWANDKVTIDEALRVAFIKGYEKGWKNEQFFEDPGPDGL